MDQGEAPKPPTEQLGVSQPPEQIQDPPKAEQKAESEGPREDLFKKAEEWLGEAKVGDVRLEAFSDVAAFMSLQGMHEIGDDKVLTAAQLAQIGESMRKNSVEKPGYLKNFRELLNNKDGIVDQIFTAERDKNKTPDNVYGFTIEESKVDASARASAGIGLSKILEARFDAIVSEDVSASGGSQTEQATQSVREELGGMSTTRQENLGASNTPTAE